MKKLVVCFFIIPLAYIHVKAQQNWVVGQSYYDANRFIEYIPGNLPIVISVPHDGDSILPPAYKRKCGSDTRDNYTQILARQIDTAFMQLMGCRPHIIINRLKRDFLDPNREKKEATCQDPNDGVETEIEKTWERYHEFIDIAKAKVVSQYGRGFFIDIHGHAHDIERLEIGYRVSADKLRTSDLNSSSVVNYSNFRALAKENKQGATHAQLLRGDFALGTILQSRGFPAVPSKQDPAPKKGDPFFAGDYLSQRHGSRDNVLSPFNSIQLEVNHEVRWTPTIRKNFAEKLALTLKEFVARFMVQEEALNACAVGSFFAPLTSFTAQKLSSTVRLGWTLSKIEDIESIEVLRSYDGLNFQSIHTISSVIQTNYTYDDIAEEKPLVFYQLKIKLKNGDIAFSQIVTVGKQGSQNITIKKSFVSADNSIFSLQLTANKASKVNVLLFDVLGRKLQAKEYSCIAGDNQIDINIHSLSRGIYGIAMHSDAPVGTIKFRKP